ncbi:small GTP-binding protein [Candidatus Nitrosoglobus terrae]|uniref:GTPase Der n=1 Tax=Candidatus Nitrosoglobus terrae TaxID=1630141 RepID=A0A1Q2SLS7_9GAMM|nr:ribosome biogenesis GTPase Der [Candidatus Nitrosoglobus terrae]BAW80095.1 small GTP-binding protein [Candidatus Nitrosoglobus terrae]
MKAVIALIGRPNVGKSTLFNRLTRSRDALVADQPGVTRDRKYGIAHCGEQTFFVVDTGGITDQGSEIAGLMYAQTQLAIEEADIILFLVDGREGLSALDETIADELRHSHNKLLKLVVNKAERQDRELIASEFYRLGLGEPAIISAQQGQGVERMVQDLLTALPAMGGKTDEIPAKGLQFAVIGRPNVGKSTLVNRLLGEERVIASEVPGTTRDSIAIPFCRHDKPYTLVDTAGIRRRSKVLDVLEKFSIVKALQAIAAAQVVILVIDARDSLVDQDLHLASLALESGKAIIITVNKWDGLSPNQRQVVTSDLDRRLSFLDFAKIHFISALHGSGVGNLFSSIDEAYQSASRHLSTGELNQVLSAAIERHPLPAVRGRRIKLRYAHQGGQNPPKIIIHGNQTESVPISYKRYLISYFRSAFSLIGTPIALEFRTVENPFKGQANPLTQRQLQKRRRLVRFRKHKDK